MFGNLIDDKQREKLAAWVTEQDEKVLAEQRKQHPTQEYVYYGCSGGAYSYIFTPTSIGLCLEVVNNVTKEKINLTNYEDW